MILVILVIGCVDIDDEIVLGEVTSKPQEK